MTRSTTSCASPRVSVIVEGYNESFDLGRAATTLAHLERQDLPCNEVEVILVGSPEQVSEWRPLREENHRFFDVRLIGMHAHYYALKNHGALVARADIVAFLDSDTVPVEAWLRSILESMEAGAEVSAGLTLFGGDSARRPDPPLRRVAASISWGFVVGDTKGSARGFLSHNLAIKRDTFRAHPYREDLGRTCAGSFLYDELARSGAKIVLHPSQRVAHNFSFGWWLGRLHVRFGHEVARLRRLNLQAPHRYLRWVPWAEPILTAAWHVMLDYPQWWRYSRARGGSLLSTIALVPALTVLSVLARSAEMLGMYATVLFPERMARFAASN